MSRSEFPRVYQLIDLIKNHTSPESYFQNFERSIEEEVEKQRAWIAREKGLQRLEKNAWDFLKNEAGLYLTAHNGRGRGWEQLISILNQARGYNFLLDLGCAEIQFIPIVKGRKTPDIEAVFAGNPVICEVKTINISASEAEVRATGKVRKISASLESGFFKKLTSDLEKAKCQMVSYNKKPGVRHIAFIVINFDDLLCEYKNNYYEEIDQHLARLPVPGTEVVFFNQRTCFHNEVQMKNAKVVNEKGH